MARPKIPPELVRKPISMTIARDLLEWIDEVARRQDRPRSKLIEIGMRDYLTRLGRRKAA